jgi:malate dehydrogenase (quinone)
MKSPTQITAVQKDVVLVGAGIMSATLAAILKELQPDLKIAIFEKWESAAQESSNAWNNAGTGHAALCELNYTPQQADGSIDIRRRSRLTAGSICPGSSGPLSEERSN